MQGKWNSIHCWWERKLIQPRIENSMELPHETRNRSTMQSNYSTTRHLAKIK
jgi:hypothetical protein